MTVDLMVSFGAPLEDGEMVLLTETGAVIASGEACIGTVECIVARDEALIVAVGTEEAFDEAKCDEETSGASVSDAGCDGDCSWRDASGHRNIALGMVFDRGASGRRSEGAVSDVKGS